MRKNSSLIMVVMAFITGCFAAQSYETLPAKMDGTMMPYDFHHGDSITPWAYTEMKPVAVSYIARHGARYLSSEKKVASLLEAVNKAKDKGSLTVDGKAFASLLDTVCIVSKGKWGALSPIGEEEEELLGKQLCQQIGVLAENLTGNAVSSYVPRVVRTMWDFLYPVAAHSKHNSLTTAEGEQFSPIVRFFDTDSTYHAYIKNGDWKSVYDQFMIKTVSPEPARRMFGPIGSDDHLRKLTMDMYGVLQSLRATGLPAPTTRWMSAAEYRACWEVSNLEHYLVRSETPLSTEAMKACGILLKNIMEKSDLSLTALEKGEKSVNGNFWFGHAETLLPLTALMGLSGCVTMPKEWSELTDVWRDYNITPLGANILIVFLKDPKRPEIHTSVRLNGIWVAPVNGEGLTPTWQSVKEHWKKRMEKFAGTAKN